MSQNELREVVVATANRGKVVEIAFILGDLPFRVRGLSPDESVLFPEEGIDYEANAIAKAEVVSSRLGCVAVADDSGLEVDALGGAPGPLSARYGGEGLNDGARVGVLLDALREVAWQDRGARFVCVAALAAPGWPTFTARGACAGRILESPQGRGGFGYDPVFRPDGYELAMAELSQAEKNRISHRGRAFETVGQELRRRVHRHGRV